MTKKIDCKKKENKNLKACKGKETHKLIVNGKINNHVVDEGKKGFKFVLTAAVFALLFFSASLFLKGIRELIPVLEKPWWSIIGGLIAFAILAFIVKKYHLKRPGTE